MLWVSTCAMGASEESTMDKTALVLASHVDSPLSSKSRSKAALQRASHVAVAPQEGIEHR